MSLLKIENEILSEIDKNIFKNKNKYDLEFEEYHSELKNNFIDFEKIQKNFHKLNIDKLENKKKNILEIEKNKIKFENVKKLLKEIRKESKL